MGRCCQTKVLLPHFSLYRCDPLHLYPSYKTSRFINLNKAYKKVKANKGAPGVDGVSVDDVYQQIVENKNQILNQIRKRKYELAIPKKS